jgi:hypothetical protein
MTEISGMQLCFETHILYLRACYHQPLRDTDFDPDELQKKATTHKCLSEGF